MNKTTAPSVITEVVKGKIVGKAIFPDRVAGLRFSPLPVPACKFCGSPAVCFILQDGNSLPCCPRCFETIKEECEEGNIRLTPTSELHNEKLVLRSSLGSVPRTTDEGFRSLEKDKAGHVKFIVDPIEAMSCMGLDLV